MLTHISIENFKGIRDRVEIDLKPITLLFGPNSAGKSTILHALLYAQEVFERHNLDADTTAAGGPFINLGGFKSMVHGHDLGLPLGVGLRFDLEEGEWKDYAFDNDVFSYFLGLGCQTEQFLATPTSAGVFLRICWADQTRGPFVQSCQVQLDSKVFAEIAMDLSAQSTTLHLSDLDHPLLERIVGTKLSAEVRAQIEACGGMAPPAESGSILRLALETLRGPAEAISLRNEEDALIRAESSLQFHPWQFRPWLPPKSRFVNRDDFQYRMGYDIHTFLDSTVTGILRSLRKRLRDFRYLGPVREIPRRNAAPPGSPDPARWSTGLGAWDRLQTCDPEFLMEVSDWLSNPERLSAGVRLGRHDLIRLDSAQRIVTDLPSGRLSAKNVAAKQLTDLPAERRVFLVPNDSDVELSLYDVGVGISQLVPVVVSALDKSTSLAAMEEPGYHLHPRLQAELGDLLIAGAAGGGRVLLVETHSEHIILRIQRRIRETARGLATPQGPVSEDQVAVYHVGRNEDATAVTRLRLDSDGDFIDEWPGGFFPERLGELR